MITLSCGHTVNDLSMSRTIYWKKLTLDYNLDKYVRCIAYGEVCIECYNEMRKLDLILHYQEESISWLNDTLPDPKEWW
jgi:hypothetical protein